MSRQKIRVSVSFEPKVYAELITRCGEVSSDTINNIVKEYLSSGKVAAMTATTRFDNYSIPVCRSSAVGCKTVAVNIDKVAATIVIDVVKEEIVEEEIVEAIIEKVAVSVEAEDIPVECSIDDDLQVAAMTATVEEPSSPAVEDSSASEDDEPNHGLINVLNQYVLLKEAMDKKKADRIESIAAMPAVPGMKLAKPAMEFNPTDWD